MRPDAAARDAYRAEPFYGLSFAAGYIDAISFIGFGGVFTANMTGNTVLLGIAIGARFGFIPGSPGLAPPLIAIATFVAGAIAAMPIFPSGFNARRAAAVVLAESALIAVSSAAFIGGHGNVVILLCIGLVAVSMGAQSVVAFHAGLPGIATTYVTGTLITAITREFGTGGNDQRVQRGRAAHAALAWIAYLVGATGGALVLLIVAPRRSTAGRRAIGGYRRMDSRPPRSLSVTTTLAAKCPLRLARAARCTFGTARPSAPST